MSQTPENTEVWYLNPEKVPEDYKTISISLEQTTDPTLPVKWCADGSLKPVPVYRATLSRGGVDVTPERLWPHKPPLDVVVHHLDDDEFKRLMARDRGPVDFRLSQPGAPEPDDDMDIIGFSGEREP